MARVGQRAAVAGEAGERARGAAWRRTRPRCRTARSADRGCRSMRRSSRPKVAGVARWSAASARPRSASVLAVRCPELDPPEHEERRARRPRRRTRPAPRARATAPGSASHRKPGRLGREEPRRVATGGSWRTPSARRRARSGTPGRRRRRARRRRDARPRPARARRRRTARRRSIVLEDGLDLGGGDEQPAVVVDHVGAHRDEPLAGVDDAAPSTAGRRASTSAG